VNWSGNYDHILVPVRAEWEGFEISLREIVNWRVGDVIELPTSLVQQTTLLLNGAPKFTGVVGLDSDRVALQITRKLPAA
jgi:flagellar motor switch protein FliM